MDLTDYKKDFQWIVPPSLGYAFLACLGCPSAGIRPLYKGKSIVLNAHLERTDFAKRTRHGISSRCVAEARR
jgi:hypothetical protein